MFWKVTEVPCGRGDDAETPARIHHSTKTIRRFAVSITMRAKQYDVLYAGARRERVSVPEMIRRDTHEVAAERSKKFDV